MGSFGRDQSSHTGASTRFQGERFALSLARYYLQRSEFQDQPQIAAFHLAMSECDESDALARFCTAVASGSSILTARLQT